MANKVRSIYQPGAKHHPPRNNTLMNAASEGACCGTVSRVWDDHCRLEISCWDHPQEALPRLSPLTFSHIGQVGEGPQSLLLFCPHLVVFNPVSAACGLGGGVGEKLESLGGGGGVDWG